MSGPLVRLEVRGVTTGRGREEDISQPCRHQEVYHTNAETFEGVSVLDLATKYFAHNISTFRRIKTLYFKTLAL